MTTWAGAGAALGSLLVLAGCGRMYSTEDDTVRAARRPGCGPGCRATSARVVRIVDGDTLVLRLDGRSTRVRLIGVDAPETWLRHDCFGAKATRALRRLARPGSAVRVAGDVEARDRYGRRLLYLWTPRGVLLNAVLVRRGLARAMAVPPDTRYASVLHDAEDMARRGRSGLWQPAPAGCV